MTFQQSPEDIRTAAGELGFDLWFASALTAVAGMGGGIAVKLSVENDTLQDIGEVVAAGSLLAGSVVFVAGICVAYAGAKVANWADRHTTEL